MLWWQIYIGNMGLFSNFSRYVARKHEKELEIFVKSDLIWSKAAFHEYLHHSIGNCEKETNWAWKNHGKIVHPWEYPSELGTIAIVPWFLQIEYISCEYIFLNAGHWSLSTEIETNLDIIPICFSPQHLVST